MKKTTLAVCMLVCGFGAFAQDMGITNPAPPIEMQTDVNTNPVASAPADVPPPPPADAAPAPIAQVSTVTTTTTVNSPPPPSQPAYSTLKYRAATDTDHRFGAGLIIGEPTGVSLKYWLNEQTAVDGALGFSTWNHSPFYVHGDVLWHKFDLIDISPADGKLPVYFGVGGLLRFRDHGRSNDVGIRVPIGVDYLFENLPVDVFAEIAPVIGVAPDLHGEITGGIGVRFWF